MNNQIEIAFAEEVGRVSILNGDVREMLRSMDAESVDCVVTSPPYWGLRDYGIDGQIGMEPTLGEHIAVMVDVMNEVRRVMKPHATLWLNLGDCYATTPNGRSAKDVKALGTDDRTYRDKPFSTIGGIQARSNGGEGQHQNRIGGILKPGDLCMVPNRIAIALQDAGWWVKSENIWGKTNPMPDSSGSSRPSAAHEKIFLLSKSYGVDWWRARDTGELSDCPDLTEQCPMITTGELGPRWIRLPYYYNSAAVRLDRSQDEDANGFRGGSYTNGTPGPRKARGNKRVSGWATDTPHDAISANRADKQRGHSRRHQGFNERWDSMTKEEQGAGGRFLRNYEAPLEVWAMATEAFKDSHFATFPQELAERCILAGCPPGGTVLDPFGGTGTVGLVASRLNRNATLIEISPEYVALMRRRLKSSLVYGLGPDKTSAAGCPLLEPIGEWE